ncbi:MAG: DUF2334 domain-containing protein [Mycobacterium sp.]
MAGDLIVSVSGIDDRTLIHLDEFSRLLDDRAVPLSLFVAPRRKLGYRLERVDVTVGLMHRRRSQGDGIVLHGFDEAATKRRRNEFAMLSAHEANLRIMAADRVLERVGLRTRLFAAPGWRTSEGIVKALPRNGFRLLIDSAGTTELQRGTVARSRLLGLGGGFRTEPWACRALVLGTERTARRGQTVRLAVTAKQLGRPGPRQALLDAVDLALMHGSVPTVYRDERRRSLRDSA